MISLLKGVKLSDVFVVFSIRPVMIQLAHADKTMYSVGSSGREDQAWLGKWIATVWYPDMVVSVRGGRLGRELRFAPGM